MAHKTTVTFSDQAWRTLTDLANETGLPMAEVIRDAIGVYRWFRTTRASGNHVLVERPDGNIREIISISN